MIRVDYILTVNGSNHVVYPISGDDVKFLSKIEGENVFLTKSFSGEFVFSRKDFDLINSYSDFQVFNLLITKVSGGITKQYYLVFHKYDCNINEDDRYLRVSPTLVTSTKELYENISNSVEVGKLAFDYFSLVYEKNALLQVYMPGSEYVDNYMGGSYWQTKVDPIIDVLVLDSFDFGYQFRSIAMIVGDGAFAGEYYSTAISGLPSSLQWQKVGGGGLLELTSGGYWELISGTDVFRSEVGEDIFGGSLSLGTGAALVDINDSTRAVNVFRCVPFARLLTDADEIDGVSTVDLSSSDFVGDSRGFSKVVPITDLVFSGSFENGSSGKYGTFQSDMIYFGGEYFQKPSFPYQAFPMGVKDWVGCSAWIQFDNDLSSKIGEGSNTITAPKSAVKLHELINQLVSKATNGSITHDLSCSEFLYNEVNPINGEENGVFVVVQKSSILFGEIEEGGKLDSLTLEDLLTALKMMRLKYHIEGNLFYIEHEQFYHLGGSYGVEQVLLDLTVFNEPVTKKPWDYYISNYEYDVTSIKYKTTYKCPESSSDLFGQIEIIAQDGMIDNSSTSEIITNNFYFDLQYAIVFSSNLSEEGFFLLECDENNDVFTVKKRSIEGVNIQNGFFSKLHLSLNFHNFVLSTGVNLVSDAVRDAESIKRIKLNSMTISARVQELSGINLINTKLGSGQVVEWDEYLHSDRIDIKTKI